MRVRLPLGALHKDNLMAQFPFSNRGKNFVRFTCDLCGKDMGTSRAEYSQMKLYKDSIIKDYRGYEICSECNDKTEEEKSKIITAIVQAKAQERLYRKRKFGGY